MCLGGGSIASHPSKFSASAIIAGAFKNPGRSESKGSPSRHPQGICAMYAGDTATGAKFMPSIPKQVRRLQYAVMRPKNVGQSGGIFYFAA